MLLAVVFVQALAALALVSGSPLHGLVRDPASGFVVTPAGLVHPSCVTRSRSGDHIIDLPSENRDFFIVQSADGNTRRVLRCTAANAWRPLRSAANGEADGWQAFTSFNNVGNKTFDAFLGTMSVPKTPSSGFGFSSRVLFYFTGLQSDNWVPENAGPFDNVPPGFDIIQPVLQYGCSEDGCTSGNWQLANWYVTVTGDVVVSDLIDMKVGDRVFGNMTRTGPQSWYITGNSVSSGQGNSITVTRSTLVSQPWAYNTLEVYGIDRCAQYPDDVIHFTDLKLIAAGKTVVPNWTAYKGQTQLQGCGAGAHAQVLSPQSVDIYFQ